MWYRTKVKILAPSFKKGRSQENIKNKEIFIIMMGWDKLQPILCCKSTGTTYSFSGVWQKYVNRQFACSPSNQQLSFTPAVCHLLPKAVQATPSHLKCLLDRPQAVYSLFQAVSLLSWGWWWVGWSVITRFKAKSIQLDWTTSQLELSLALRLKLSTAGTLA